jgi:hypothetical protein
VNELALGARFAFAGGWTRAGLTAVGVGLGVALLLLAASLPTALQARDDRNAARDDRTTGTTQPTRGAGTLLVGTFDTTYGERDIRGRLLQPEGPRAPVPPGVRRLPRPGELVVSPALGALLKTRAGELLAARLRAKVIGTIGHAGLQGPGEYAFYLGSDRLEGAPSAHRISAFGTDGAGGGYGSVLTLLVVIALVVLLLPVGVFIATAARFGGEQRERRMAALRLLGADAAMARRVAAGESAAGAVLGLGAGALLFLAGRQLAGHLTLWDISVFPADVRPSLVLTGLVAAAVPATAVVVTVLALGRVVVEPLGVVRRAAGGRRRLWWRLAIPALGLVTLAPLLGGIGAGFNAYQVGTGVVALLVGLTALLPSALESALRRLRGGAIAWQLAVRRLQLDAGASARAVSGIAVAVAGAIALQTLFAVVQERSMVRTGADPTRAQVLATARAGPAADELVTRFASVPGVGGAVGFTTVDAAAPGRMPTLLTVARCPALRELARVGRCNDGDVFLVAEGNEPAPRPNDRLVLGPDLVRTRWMVPATARPATGRPGPGGAERSGILATPGAVGAAVPPDASVEVYARIQRDAPPATLELLRNAAAAADPLTQVLTLQAQRSDHRFAGIRRALFAGALITLALIGASMLVTAVEQLRERRRLLAVLVAFGTKRSTLAWSVLWQAAVPVVVGLVLAVAVGLGLGAVLLAMVREPVGFSWGSIAGMAGAGAAVVLSVTALSLPPLWRLMRPDGLRTE